MGPYDLSVWPLFVIIGDTESLAGGLAMRSRMIVRIALACAIVALALVFASLRAHDAGRAAAPHLAAFVDRGANLQQRPAPNFSLVDQYGRRASLAQWRGKVVVLAFVDDRCTTICPLTTQSMVQALRLLGPAAARVQLVGVNANPLHVSVQDVRDYSRQHGLAGDWAFLTGSRAQLSQVWRQYGIAVAIQQGAIDHTPALYVIDQQGRERRIYVTASQYAGVGQEAYVLAKEVASLLPGHVSVATPSEAASGISPGTLARLPLANGGNLAIGPGHPHLYLFLDAWAPGAARELPLAAGYAAEAKAQGLPALVVVDVRNLETSAGALPGLVASLPGARGLTLAVDLSGRVADGYGAQDIPWYALTNAQGNVVWSHDGWAPAGTLLKAARQTSS